MSEKIDYHKSATIIEALQKVCEKLSQLSEQDLMALLDQHCDGEFTHQLKNMGESCDEINKEIAKNNKEFQRQNRILYQHYILDKMDQGDIIEPATRPIELKSDADQEKEIDERFEVFKSACEAFEGMK